MKSITFLICLLFTVNTFAQSKKDIGFGFKIGRGNSFVAFNKEVNSSISSNSSDVISAFLNYSLSEKLNVQPNLSYTVKGFNAFEEQSGFKGDVYFNASKATSTRLYYVELPINAILKLPLGKGKVLLGGGPYVAFAFSGKSNVFTRTTSSSASLMKSDEKRTVKFGNETSDDFNPFDFGVGFLVGYQLKKGWLFNFNYSQGIANILPKEQRANDFKAIIGAYQICVGYEF